MPKPCETFLNFVDPSDQVSVLRNLACSSLVHHGFTHAMLCAHRGNDPLFLALLRPYPSGDHIVAIEEQLTLATALGANRIAFCSTGRAWSANDPVPPVCDDGDLRQRVVMVTQAALGHPSTDTPTDTTYLWPLEECLTGAAPTVLHDGIGPLHSVLMQAVQQSEDHSPPEPWGDNQVLQTSAAIMLDLERDGHQFISLGPKLEHTLGLWLDRMSVHGGTSAPAPQDTGVVTTPSQPSGPN
ncbi:hypothetical protein [Stomatohabitans albus]|uniref:hypothetical protein n=1 Tax=Stomatohabitans albus TaxID=3110766 RepID=UPI00300C3043